MIPTISKNRVTKNPATSIDQIITKTIADTQFKNVIIQADLSDDFPILFTNQTNENVVEKHNKHFVYKRWYDQKSTNFKQKLHEITWNNIRKLNYFFFQNK